MKYSAINIGPIISTLGMARKPRELWAASYMFSYLARCIYKEIETKNIKIISPEKPAKENNKVGIYPDRIFIEGAPQITTIIEDARNEFCTNTRLSKNCFEQYFNVMTVTDNAVSESEAIRKLNQKLDVLELCNYAADKTAANDIRRLITKTYNSPLFKIETGDKDRFPFDINTLAEIATARLRGINGNKWDSIKSAAREKERKDEKDRAEKNESMQTINEIDKSIDLDENDFYKALAKAEEYKGKIKSHHKYFCVVQADGDNVGKTVSHPDLQEGQVRKISIALVQFGQEASRIIENYGGLPLYAGGDDLLFIAPVIGENGSNIFNLINKIENDAFNKVVDEVKKCGKENKGIFFEGKKIEASLSFGISISYYKYPLYEALESARKLLFDTAKTIDQKKAVAWSFRKHSGGTFNAVFSLKNEDLQKAFRDLINATNDDIVVSAVAHKLRQEEKLVNTVMDAEQSLTDDADHPRLNALFEKVLEFQENDYFKCVKSIMPLLYKVLNEKDKFIPMLYSLLRTAKFIKGEDMRDE